MWFDLNENAQLKSMLQRNRNNNIFTMRNVDSAKYFIIGNHNGDCASHNKSQDEIGLYPITSFRS